MLLLSRSDVEAALTIGDAIGAVEEAFGQYQEGNTLLPLRTTLPVPEHRGAVLLMPAFIKGSGALGAKVVSAYGENPAKYGLPTIMATIVLNDPRTGEVLAIMDGAFLTAMRTGAASGVATKYLARTGATTVGILGAGVQARTQLSAICAVRPIAEARVYDVNEDAVSKFCSEMATKMGIAVIAVSSSQQAVTGCDVIATATTSKTPILDGAWLTPGTHINGVGSHSPGLRELDSLTIQRSKVVVDQREACLAEAGDLILPIKAGEWAADQIYGELGQVVTGELGRESQDDITLFKSVGLAIQDIATAQRVYQQAVAQGIGQTVRL
ncbi:MAG TPA: ornithine cyclodeaminase family protein [Anaerolineae bacterium]|nr:ornithine cyclodeaminase family protein [Anaerolineae bacterium]